MQKSGFGLDCRANLLETVKNDSSAVRTEGGLGIPVVGSVGQAFFKEIYYWLVFDQPIDVGFNPGMG